MNFIVNTVRYGELEDKEESLEAIDANNKTATILSFIRHGKRKKDFLVVVMNLTTIEQQNFEIGVPLSRKLS